eukprot:8181227-Pyramimonas_sp.AAC.1
MMRNSPFVTGFSMLVKMALPSSRVRWRSRGSPDAPAAATVRSSYRGIKIAIPPALGRSVPEKSIL